MSPIGSIDARSRLGLHGVKVDDCLTAALCVECHSRIDQGADMTRVERRHAMDQAILKTLVQLARLGLVKP